MLVKRSDGTCLNLDCMLLIKEGSDKDRLSILCTSESGFKFTIIGITLTTLKSYPSNSIINAEWVTSNCAFVVDDSIHIEIEKMDKIKQLKIHINKILLTLGHPEGLVTNESYVTDFLSLVKKERAAKIKKLEKRFNIKFNSKMKMYELAEYIKESGG